MLKQLVPDIQKTAELVQEISSASTEQKSGVDQINNAILLLDKVIQRNSGVSELMANRSKSLAEQAEVLSESMSVFKIGSDKDTEMDSETENNMVVLPKRRSTPIIAEHIVPEETLEESFEEF